MNKEQQELLDDVYETYTNYPLATIQDHHTNILYQNLYKGWCILIGLSIVSPHPTRHLTKEEFINKCKTDTEFSERWGLKIEERELSLEERSIIAKSNHYEVSQNIKRSVRVDEDRTLHKNLDEINIPTKLITITYNDKTIESYES
jgi:hypothetical protein